MNRKFTQSDGGLAKPTGASEKKKIDGYSTQHVCLLVWNLNLTRIDPFNNIMRGLAIHCAANALGSSQNLLHAAREFLC